VRYLAISLDGQLTDCLNNHQMGCKAAITLKYLLNGEKVEVDYQWQHSSHDPYSRLSLSGSKIPRGLRLWVKDLAGKGMSSTQMAAIVRLAMRAAYQVCGR
jgi:hypothetical protein